MAWIHWDEWFVPSCHTPNNYVYEDGKTIEQKFPQFYYQIPDELAKRLDTAQENLTAVIEEIESYQTDGA